MKLFGALALVMGLGLSGCLVHHRRVHHHNPHGSVTVIQTGHVHSAHCGHYRHGGNWHVIRNHHHRAGCGHVHRGGVWVRGH